MGILDKKVRIFDTIITNEGRRQISLGEMRPRFVSFGDLGAIYNTDTLEEGGLDELSRITFEAKSDRFDLITPEADLAGKIEIPPFENTMKTEVFRGQIFQTEVGQDRPLSGSQFGEMVEQLLGGSLTSFKNLKTLTSPDVFDRREKIFTLSQPKTTFTITNNNPISETDLQEASIDQIESLFYDKRLSHISNFKFLPPVNKRQLGATENIPLGNYVSLNQEDILTFSDVEDEIKDFESRGYSETFSFIETSNQNNIFSQFFEVANGEIKKLTVIDFGIFPAKNESGKKHVFFIGKTYSDDFGAVTFVHLFTLIFD
jgi:hypothetical protein